MNGYIPDDEPFMPWCAISAPGSRHRFPLWLSLEIVNSIHKLREEGKVLTTSSRAHWIGKDEVCRVVAWLKINEVGGVLVESAMRAQQFPISEDEALDEIIMFDLFERLKRVLSGEEAVQPISSITKRLKTIAGQEHVMQFVGCGDELLGIFIYRLNKQ